MKAIHHVNGDPRDNRPENLLVVNTKTATCIKLKLDTLLGATLALVDAMPDEAVIDLEDEIEAVVEALRELSDGRLYK